MSEGGGELVVRYADDLLIAIDKPAGMLSVPGRGADKADCASSRAQARWPEALVVHRLDMATSGLLLMARGLAMQRRLAAAFEGREVHKRYIAVAAGLLRDDEGEIDAPLMRDWPNRPLQKVDFALGRPAQTRFRVLARDPQAGTTRVELTPVTGRTHQLRLHLAHIGHPIVGDALYAPEPWRSYAPRLLLHAAALAMPHPLGGRWLELASPVPF